jgi:excinuclease UvrABC nuclease subunit
MADTFPPFIIPNSPGVHAVNDRGGYVIYVGISKKMRGRIDQRLVLSGCKPQG